MEIVMTRSAERMSTTRVRRDDGATLELPSYVPFDRLPHDFAHFVVESVLGLTWGFWGSIAHGAIFGRMQVVVPRRRAAGAAERSRKLMKRASSQITEAEALVGTVVDMYQRRLDRDWTTARALLAGMWRPARPSRALPNQVEIRRICEALAKAQRRWLDLAVGQSLTLHWPQQRADVEETSVAKTSLAEQRISPDGRARVRSLGRRRMRTFVSGGASFENGMNTAGILVVTGASGSGKTAIVRALEARALSGVRCYYFDAVGVPSAEYRGSGGPEGWQAVTTKEWISRLAADPDGAQVYVLDGQTRPSFVRSAVEGIHGANVRIVLLDCTPEVRHARLVGPRGQPELSNSQMDCWAAYLRGQADALNLPVIDTTDLGIDAAVDALVVYVEQVRAERAAAQPKAER